MTDPSIAASTPMRSASRAGQGSLGRLLPPLAGILAVLLSGGCGGDAGDPPAAAGEAVEAGAPDPGSAEPRRDTIHLYDLGHRRGDPDAPIIVFEFSEYGCPFSASFAAETYPALAREFIETRQVQWIYIPIVVGGFQNGELAARTVECAAEQGAFERAQVTIFEEQQAWRGTGPAQAPGYFTRLAAGMGLDAAAFSACVGAPRVAERLTLNRQAAGALQVAATPTFVVDGRRVEGALPADQFRAVLEQVIEERAERGEGATREGGGAG